MDQPASQVEAPVLAEAPTLPNPVDYRIHRPCLHPTRRLCRARHKIPALLAPATHLCVHSKDRCRRLRRRRWQRCQQHDCAQSEGVEFLVCNTDAQHLATTLTDNRVQLGAEVTGGLGCGANPTWAPRPPTNRSTKSWTRSGTRHGVHHRRDGGGTGTGAAHDLPSCDGLWHAHRSGRDATFRLRGPSSPLRKRAFLCLRVPQIRPSWCQIRTCSAWRQSKRR